MLLQENEYEKQTNLDPKSFWGIWSRLSTDDYAKDSCSLIKNSILSILLLPLWIFPGLLINGISMWRNVYYGIQYWRWSLINISITVLGGLVSFGAKQHFIGLQSILNFYCVGVVCIVGIIIVVIIIFCSAFLYEYIKDTIVELFQMKKNERNERNEMSVIKTFLKDLKKKHCTLIHWDKK